MIAGSQRGLQEKLTLRQGRWWERGKGGWFGQGERQQGPEHLTLPRHGFLPHSPRL